mgnify:CR=1 FL=1
MMIMKIMTMVADDNADDTFDDDVIWCSRYYGVVFWEFNMHFDIIVYTYNTQIRPLLLLWLILPF